MNWTAFADEMGKIAKAVPEYKHHVKSPIFAESPYVQIQEGVHPLAQYKKEEPGEWRPEMKSLARKKMKEQKTPMKVSSVRRRSKAETGLPLPAGLKNRGVSMGRDKNGYFVYTHRAGSDSYPSPDKIPESAIKFIESTG